MNMQAVIADLNRSLAERRTDVEWIIGPNGAPTLVDREDWSRAHHRAEKDRLESERQCFNWRLQHPINETREGVHA